MTGSNLLGKGAIFYMTWIKALMVVVMAVGALSLGACAQRRGETMSTTTTGTTGYRK
jgi:hypothetical protein